MIRFADNSMIKTDDDYMFNDGYYKKFRDRWVYSIKYDDGVYISGKTGLTFEEFAKQNKVRDTSIIDVVWSSCGYLGKLKDCLENYKRTVK